MKENHKQYVWTIEHIFPQSKNIPQCWENMIAGGDKSSAKKIQEECVDRIGNLTLSGINQELSNKCFEEKKGGYDNGLFLNEDLKNCDKWTRDQIMKRTDRLANKALELFALNEKKVPQQMPRMPVCSPETFDFIYPLMGHGKEE